ncbi:MAG: hypothetical protein EOP06_16780 [Proteobacteria bacterium]|nr:MAG: hypothetical protein EOP06_16780 [Pseudomonadota bacterium]
MLRKHSATRKIKLDKLTVGAGPLLKATAEYALQYLCNELYCTYGLTQAGPRVTCGRVVLATFSDGWVGYPLKDVSLMLSTDSELIIKTPYASVDIGPNDPLHTEDIFDGDVISGLIFRSRKSDVIYVRGRTVARSQWSSLLTTQLGFPVEILQEQSTDRIFVFVESGLPSSDFELQALRSFPELRESRFICLSTFPRTVLGKTDLRMLWTLI